MVAMVMTVVDRADVDVLGAGHGHSRKRDARKGDDELLVHFGSPFLASVSLGSGGVCVGFVSLTPSEGFLSAKTDKLFLKVRKEVCRSSFND